VFVRALGLVWLGAFTSLGAQVRGLYGRRGVLPIGNLLERADALLGKESRRAYPSIFWLGHDDAALVRACRVGQVLSIALVCGVAPRPVLFSCWALYLSFVSVGRDFLSFQWDILLLETTLHALVVAPRGLWARSDEEPPLHAVLLMRWLAARFYAEAGFAKLLSGDETWRTRTACCYHYETQPLPTALGWYAHHLSRRSHRAATTIALGIECGAPLLAFAPRRARMAGFFALTGLQVAIAATGNYGFFNPLSIVLALFLLDDDALARVLPRRERPPPRRAGLFANVTTALGAATLFAAAIGAHLQRFGKREPPRPLARLAEVGSQLRSMTAYGLFASMTRVRREIAIEGSDDGDEWHEYEFRYKPGDSKSRPRWVAPHQPRLDWQMWFAALSLPPAWFAALMQRLLEGSPDVLALFERTPFGDRPPRYVRAVFYDQRMTDLETRRRTGEWWRRRELGLYFPVVTLGSAAGAGVR
jgi:hypothetical protein